MTDDAANLTRLFDGVSADYEILECYIGDESVVCRARDRKLERQVAIKTPNDAVMADAKRLARYLTEARNLARVNHENVLRVYAFFETGERGPRCYLVTEWFDRNLALRQAASPLRFDEAFRVIEKILSGIRAIHAAGLMHRDLTPSNVLLSEGLERVAIADLGSAERDGDQTHIIGPSARYQPPETYDAQLPFDERADLYSAGFIAYELLLGPERFADQFESLLSAPTDEERNRRWINWHMSQLPPPLSLLTDVPEAISVLVTTLLAKDPADRFDRAETALAELHKARADSTLPELKPIDLNDADGANPTERGHDRPDHAKPRPGQRADKRSKRIKTGWVIGGVASLLLLLVILLVALSGPSPERLAAEEAIAELRAARAAAEAAGADHPEPLSAFVAAGQHTDRARAAWEQREYVALLAPAHEAVRLYREAESTALARPAAEAARSAATQAREAALDADAHESFQTAQEIWGRAEAEFADRDYAASADLHRAAEESFNAALVSWAELQESMREQWAQRIAAARGEAEDARREALAEGAVADDLSSADRLFDAAAAAADAERYEDALGGFTAATEAFNSAAPVVSAEPIRFRAGLDSDGIAAALDLCRQYGTRCRAEDYATEMQREVVLAPFMADRTEVANARFARFVAETGYRTESEDRGFSYGPPVLAMLGDFQAKPGVSWRRPDGADSTIDGREGLPVVHVTRADADAFCAWAGGRLPTEAEWELVARGGEGRVFPWGAAWRPSAVHQAASAMPVASNPAGNTPAGAADLAGNVWEWTATDLQGKAVLKGGSWRERANPANLRSTVQLVLAPDESQDDVGFRCVYPAERWSTDGEPVVSSQEPGSPEPGF
ncbi:MAG: hypothetical protein EOM22_00340 [Gammaproteobacteria bacterium]|nr:hypothetical protein [Gammaproteobacteria bacterium]